MNNDAESVPIMGIGSINNFTYAAIIQTARLDILVKAETMDKDDIIKMRDNLKLNLCQGHQEGETCYNCITIKCLVGTLESILN